jgi:hypothetical protein
MNIEITEDDKQFLNVKLSSTNKEDLKTDDNISDYYVNAFLRENNLIAVDLVEVNKSNNEIAYKYRISTREAIRVVNEELLDMQDDFIQTGEGKEDILKMISDILDRGCKVKIYVEGIDV